MHKRKTVVKLNKLRSPGQALLELDSGHHMWLHNFHMSEPAQRGRIATKNTSKSVHGRGISNFKSVQSAMKHDC